jgi:hypothetical protein
LAALWPETRPRYARGRFHTTMSELRQLLYEALGDEAIVRADDRYKLDPARVNVDLWRLNTAVDRAPTAVDPNDHVRALHTVIGLYTGVVADGHSWLWLAPTESNPPPRPRRLHQPRRRRPCRPCRRQQDTNPCQGIRALLIFALIDRVTATSQVPAVPNGPGRRPSS